MYTGIYFLIESIFYMALLISVFFRRNKFKSQENNIYSALIIIASVELLLELMLDYIGPMYQSFPTVSFLLARVYCICLLAWITNLCLYIVVVTLHMKQKYSYIKWLKLSMLILTIIFSVLICKLPINFYYDGNVAYTYGMGVNIVYISSTIYIIMCCICMIYNKKNIADKRFVPLLLFIVIGGVGSFIQYKYPGLLLAVPIHAFITFLMYFTIENPDMKMLEEVHKAKEISDNSNEEKTMFLYNMTNEIRDITRDIDKSADNILGETDNKEINIDYIEDETRDIKGSTAKFTTMTNEILDISSIDSQNIKIYNDKYNIKLILKQLVTLYKDKAKNKGISFRTEIASDVPEYLYGDSVGVKTSLTSILDNAIKYTEKGYVELRVNTIIKKDICRLLIVVEDSGVGMKAEEIENLFNKHKEELEKDNLKNNLYTTRKVITLMGGALIPSSTYGTGTTMKIVLDQKIVDTDDTLDKYGSVYDKKRMLLVDDSEASIKLIGKYLNGTNIEVDNVRLGKECLDKMRNKEKYDLILLDEDMKPLNGIEVMRKLKEIRTFNTKVILLTRNNNYEYSDDYLKYGFSDYVLKPIDKDKLLEKIDKCLK